MAIQKSYTHPNGTTFASAYHKIEKIDYIARIDYGGNVENGVVCHLAIFKDKEARDDGKVPIRAFSFMILNSYPTFDFDTYMAISILNQENVNSVMQAYEYMKSRPDLGGVDYTTGVTDV